MHIEVKHDVLVSPSRTLVVVYNPKLADERLDHFVMSKYDRGFRLRHLHRDEFNKLGYSNVGILELGSHSRERLNAAIRCLKDGGFYIKEIGWRTHPRLT